MLLFAIVQLAEAVLQLSITSNTSYSYSELDAYSCINMTWTTADGKTVTLNQTEPCILDQPEPLVVFFAVSVICAVFVLGLIATYFGMNSCANRKQ